MNKLLLTCALLFTSNAHAFTSFVAGYMLGSNTAVAVVDSTPVTQQAFVTKPGRELITCTQSSRASNKCSVDFEPMTRAQFAANAGFNCIHAWALQLPSGIIIMEVSNQPHKCE